MHDLRGFWKEPQQKKPQKTSEPSKRKTAKTAARKARRKAQREARRLGVTAHALASVQPRATGRPHPAYRKDDAFYSSEAWRRVRYVALKMHGARCQCCGATASDGSTICVDHIIPRYKAPHLALEVSNLQVLCADCNIGKAAWDQTDWRPSICDLDADALAHMKSIIREAPDKR